MAFNVKFQDKDGNGIDFSSFMVLWPLSKDGDLQEIEYFTGRK